MQSIKRKITRIDREPEKVEYGRTKVYISRLGIVFCSYGVSPKSSCCSSMIV